MIIIKRSELVKEVAYRTGLTQKEVKAVIECEEQVVYENIALNSSVKYLWGTIEGITIPPKRIAGCYSQLRQARNNNGWSVLKKGVPKCTFSRIAKAYYPCDPAEWFEAPEHRYTSQARIWRKDCGVPEIPEYIGLPEEKIKKLCKKADEKEIQSQGYGKRKLKMLDYQKEYNIRRKLADRYYWEKTGYVPMGALYFEELGDQNYTGPQRTFVDVFKERAEKATDPDKKLYYYKKAEAMAKELDEEKKEKERANKLAEQIEEKIRQERIRIKNIENKEERNYYTYGYDDETYNKLVEMRDKRMKENWSTIDEYKAGLKKKKEEFRENIKNSTLTLEDFGITVDENGNMFDSNGNLINPKKDENNNEDNNLNEEDDDFDF